ncbi:MAG: efflux RND transporter periplasmic adaptor subunit [Rubrivivax sp.]
MFSNVAAHQAHRMSGAPGWIVLCLVAALGGCQRAAEAPAPEIRPVRAVTIEKRDVGGAVVLTGTVQAQAEINQSFRIDGRMIERTVDVGDTVKPGQLIARLDPQNEESGLQAARAQLASANAQLVEARSNYTRMSELVVEDAVSRAQVEQAQSLLKSAEAQVEALRAQVSLSQNRLSYTRLVSSVAGVVTARGPQPGEVVSAGRMIIQVARESARDAVFDVPAQVKDNVALTPEPPAAAGRGKAPPPARLGGITLALSTDPSVTATGIVREVSPRADPVTGTFAVRVRLIDAPAAMRLGTTVTGRIQLETVSTISIPASALVRTDGKTAVWVFDRKVGTVSLRPISVRAADSSTVQVADGLTPGDMVVTAGVQALRPGQKVRLLETKS